MAMKWRITPKVEGTRNGKVMRDFSTLILSPEDRIRKAMVDFEESIVSRKCGKNSTLWEHQHTRAEVRSRSSKLYGASGFRRPGERKEKISVALYPSTIRLLDEACGREVRSRSNLIEVILRRHLPEMMEEGPEAAEPSSID